MALLEAGLAETLERNGEVPSIEALCRRAGYTRGAFYGYFETRDQFISEMLDWVLTDIVRVLFVRPTEEAANLQEVVEGFTHSLSAGEWPDLNGEIRAAYMAILRELRPGSNVRDLHARLMQGIADRLEQLIREGQGAGTVREDAEPRHVAMLLLTSAIGTIVWDGVGIPMDMTAMGRATMELMDPPR